MGCLYALALGKQQHRVQSWFWLSPELKPGFPTFVASFFLLLLVLLGKFLKREPISSLWLT